jgi:hypothetical protein
MRSEELGAADAVSSIPSLDDTVSRSRRLWRPMRYVACARVRSLPLSKSKRGITDEDRTASYSPNDSYAFLFLGLSTTMSRERSDEALDVPREMGKAEDQNSRIDTFLLHGLSTSFWEVM